MLIIKMDDEKNFQIFIDEITREQDKEENRLCDNS